MILCVENVWLLFIGSIEVKGKEKSQRIKPLSIKRHEIANIILEAGLNSVLDKYLKLFWSKKDFIKKAY